MISQHPKSARAGFTLIEILAVLTVITLLAAILFPVFARARQSGRQTRCSTNLHQIYLATRQYYQDQQGYPTSLAPMLPAGTTVVFTTGGSPLNFIPDEAPSSDGTSGSGSSTSEMSTNSSNAFVEDEPEIRSTTVSGSVGYLQSMDVLTCPSDTDTENVNGFASSYDTKTQTLWNFWGYDERGYAMSGQTETLRPEVLVNPALPYDGRRNPVRFSLSNRFASPQTIITHCIYHRNSTSRLKNPTDLYNPADPSAGLGASDIILRLDGTVKLRDVSGFKGNGTSTGNQWQVQTP